MTDLETAIDRTAEAGALNIADLAGIAFREMQEGAEKQGDDMFDEHREQLLSAARQTALMKLGPDVAVQLAWQFTGTAELPPDIEQAVAVVDEGPDYLRYRYNVATEITSFELVEPCRACGRDKVSEIHDLVGLGALLEAAVWDRELS
ncbi:hypothetical protein N4G70_29245 [Streptomyces sp. ASQP_92]|uniref:hypothetical protein n=1 Tax=Streptomyces sp. ASQP_92 TaxID=2979116 RepID=UPI0021C0E95A|nr:hypothetical protein [Streptomyces sp. ASQP_92]MCT9092927.1 hypothetical protein [Streptomyces sp. ASQP_92]